MRRLPRRGADGASRCGCLGNDENSTAEENHTDGRRKAFLPSSSCGASVSSCTWQNVTARACPCNLQRQSASAAESCLFCRTIQPRSLWGCDGLRWDFLRNSGAEQKVKSLRSWSSADQGSQSLSVATQPLAIGEHVPVTAHSIYHFRGSDGTSKILIVETTVEHITVPPLGPPFARLLSEHTELMSWSGGIVTQERDRLPRRRGGGKTTTRWTSR